MRRVALALVLAAAPAYADEAGNVTKPSGSSVITKDEEGEPKLSLPTESDRIAWTKSGFRLGLGLDYGRFDGLRGAPSGRLLGPFLHAGLRLDADWSIFASFSYESASQSGGLSGLRFVGTVDPTWHVTRALSLAFGFGFGGIVEGGNARVDHAPTGDGLVSITIPSADPPIGSCSGVGVVGALRASYSWVLGPRSSTDVELAIGGQYTSCVEKTGMLDPDTAQPITRTQYWPHVGVTLGWGFMWR